MQLTHSLVYSFDIFDTVLTRKVGDPQTVFQRCGDRAIDRGLLQVSSSVFQAARVAAESRARTIYNAEVTLTEIYSELRNSLNLSGDQTQQLLKLELEIEAELIISVPRAKEWIEQTRQIASTIVFTSDMYLPKAFLVEQLKRYRLWQEHDRLYVSGEVRKSKSTGELFQVVLSDLKLHPEQLIHTGNNYHADVQAAKAMKVATVFKPDANLNRFEQILQDQSASTDGESPLWAGASRCARLAHPASSNHSQTVREVAAGIAAPAIVAYVAWILQSAQQEGLERLYFLARDGEILLKVARLLAPQINPTIELRYLYASRQALRLPAMTEINETVLDWIFEPSTILTIEAIWLRVGLQPEDFEPVLTSWGFGRSTWQRNLSVAEREQMRSHFSSCQEIITAISKSAQRERAILHDYLTQEGVLSTQRCGMVDLGWRGSLQAALEKVLQPITSHFPTWYYFGFLKTTPLQGKSYGFFFDHLNQSGFYSITHCAIPMMEIFCAGTHGTTLSYQRMIDQSISPRLKEHTNTIVNDWGLPVLQEAVLDFTRALIESNVELSNPKLYREAIAASFTAFWYHPSKAEMTVLGSFPFFDEPNEQYYTPWASPVRLIDVFQFAIGHRSDYLPMSSWQTVSMAQSSGLVKFLLPIVRFFRYGSFRAAEIPKYVHRVWYAFSQAIA
ncbi:HAD family hydrolase [Leptolyngbya sp. NIES-2104]|uniref:HAD family hydrolase n=1 Tax=Leptolyngbya sp. NIES-2104 TaxID=1552121 RepID=UPI0006EC88D4|nr:hypothetical protein [Leptolyngbya sp. NIES-2104]GAP95137.1 predicted hydrolase [Leptolyngbya sp. NIES-2104]